MISSKIYDEKIGAYNYSIEITIGEYYELVKDCLKSNEYQRRRVSSSGSVYNLLKQDLIEGCVMPPIVLAICKENIDDNDIMRSISSIGNLKILDGLQRTFTIRDIVNDYYSGNLNWGYDAENPLHHKMRIELYVGINKLGILYRMLTLNAGQTRMTTRHQIEIIYSEYNNSTTITGVKMLTELDDESPKQLGEYKFRDIVEGFTSYLQKDYLTLDKKEILDNISDLERLAGVVKDKELFYDFVDTYHHLVYRLHTNMPFDYDEKRLVSECNLTGAPFANSIMRLLNKSQSLTGYGCAMAELCEKRQYEKLKDLHSSIDMVNIDTSELAFRKILTHLDEVRREAKKIGNDQRKYFYCFFSCLYNKDSYTYLDLVGSADQAFVDYKKKKDEKY